MSETPDCPKCETDVLVGKANGPYYTWRCHGCDHQWDANPIRPIAFDDVEQWYEPRSPDGTRLHADRGCPATDALLTHSPEKARENRHSRCLTCGHEVFES